MSSAPKSGLVHEFSLRSPTLFIAEKETASILQPPNSSTSTAPVDLQGIGDFLGEVNRLLQALDPPPEGEPAATGKTDKQRD